MFKNVIFLSFLSIISIGCSSIFPKLEKGDSGVSPKKNLIARIIPANQVIGQFSTHLERSSPLVVGEVIYQGSIQNHFFALQKKSGRKIWEKSISGGVESTAAYFDKKVYFGGNDGIFYCVEADTGKTAWSYNAKVEILSTPVIIGEIVYFSTIQNAVYALKADSGEWVWYYNKGYDQKLSIRGNSSPVYYDGKIYIGFSDGTIHALNAFNGNMVWSKKVSQGGKFIDVDMTPIVGEKNIVIGSSDGELYSLNPVSGDTQWKKRYLNMTDVAANNDFIYVTTNSRHVFGLNRKTGQQVWETRLKSGVPVGAILVEDQLVINTENRYVYSLGIDNGQEIWRYNLDTGVNAKPSYDNEKLYIFSNHSVLHVVDPFYLLSERH